MSSWESEKEKRLKISHPHKFGKTVKALFPKTKNETKGKQISSFPFPGNGKIPWWEDFSPVTTQTRDRKTRTSKKGDFHFPSRFSFSQFFYLSEAKGRALSHTLTQTDINVVLCKYSE